MVQDVSRVRAFFFFPSGEHLPFPPSSICGIRPLLVQSPAEGHEQERVPEAGGCSTATCLAAGKTACRNWEHLSDSHILAAAPASPAAGEAPAEAEVGFHPIYIHIRPQRVLRFNAEIMGICVNDLQV